MEAYRFSGTLVAHIEVGKRGVGRRGERNTGDCSQPVVGEVSGGLRLHLVFVYPIFHGLFGGVDLHLQGAAKLGAMCFGISG
jgi:hypothetical protein